MLTCTFFSCLSMIVYRQENEGVAPIPLTSCRAACPGCLSALLEWLQSVNPSSRLFLYPLSCFHLFIVISTKIRPSRIFRKVFCLFLRQFGKSVLNCLYNIIYCRMNTSQINSISNLHPHRLSHFDFCAVRLLALQLFLWLLATLSTLHSISRLPL